jgi:hypothetical protein
MCQESLVKLSNIEFHENPFTGSRAISREQAQERRPEEGSLTGDSQR